MSLGNYSNGSTTVGSTATLVCSVDSESSGVLVQNNGSVAVVFGGADVTSSTGISVAAAATLFVPSIAGTAHELYGITASSTAAVTFLFPQAS
jgi:hypothetical protein